MSISAADYIRLTCLLETADVTQVDADNSLIEMQNTLTNTRGVDLNIARLRDEISGLRGKISEYRAVYPPTLIDAARRLQQHVIKYYGSVNDFLSSNNVKISPFFAAVSLQAGYKIDTANVGDSCA